MSQMSRPAGQEIRRPRREVIPAGGPAVRLEDLERMAGERNPTLAQSDLALRAAEGRRRQAGLFPNPVVGYSAEELAFRAPSERGAHGFFVEQTIPLGGKLGKAKRVFAAERDQAAILAESQRARVLNSVRVLYYDALGAQRLVELRDDLSQLAREAVEITRELYNVGQADRPDQLEIEIEAERAEIDFLKARTDWEQSWRALAAVVGDPALKPARLAETPEEATAALDEEQLLATLLRDSPEIRSAQAGLERARSALALARSRRVPDLFVRGGVAYNRERLEGDGRRTGAEGVFEVGVSVPVFDRNQGGIAAAEAEVGIAEREQQRLQLSLRSRFASGFREYRNAQQTAERYRTRVVPRARQAYEMYLSNFRQMAASYPQVLIAQRTLFQVEVEYARALVDLRRSAVGLRGFMLAGGLDAVGRPGESGREAAEGFAHRGANDN
ncbi:MAG: TolC family protein [Acidobacteria bacterium]|nr:TolC family protein [Acidobacteriota bacterium]